MIGWPPGPLRVLAIGAHPDDIEIGCGGTLLALASERTVDLATLILTGSPDRAGEAARAAERFGARTEPVFANLADTRLPEQRAEVRDALRAFRDEHPVPDVLFVPRSDDAHQDHRLVGSMAPTVWRGPLLLHYEIPKWDGDLGRPNVYVPIPEEIAARKVELLDDSFPSQRTRPWWDAEVFLGLMRLRGMESASRYAEAFTTDKLTLGVVTA